MFEYSVKKKADVSKKSY